MLLLVFNAGSSSLKFDLLERTEGGTTRRLKAGAFVDKAGGSGSFALETSPGPELASPAPPLPAPIRSLAAAADFVLAWLADESAHGRNFLAEVAATVHRVVHGGELFRATTRLGAAELASLAKLDELAPLHNPPALAVIATVQARLGRSLPLIGVFDTAYYATLPEAAWRYAVPDSWYKDFGVRRYGFHGTAHRYLCTTARTRVLPGKPTARVVSLQLGRGCSVTATLDDGPVATSMGFTPVEGLVMGTRSGDFDPGALLHVMEHAGLSPAQMRTALNTESGLKALSGGSADMQELLRREQQGDAGAQLAIEIFCRRARHYLGAFVCELGGVDVIAFGGGIGENSAEIRRRIVRGLDWAGISIDEQANRARAAGSIGASDSWAAIEVVRVDEASVLADEAAALLKRAA
jgi:acetate kinase